jgi:hypothetical protein
MEVYLEKKVMEDCQINQQPEFAQIRDNLYTFKEGQLSLI